MTQLLSFVRKEFYHIFRDKRTMMILLLMPVLLIILFGYAITTEIQQVDMAVFDQAQTPLTRRITERLGANDYFSLYKMVGSQQEAHDLFRKGKVKLVVVFPAQYTGTPEESIQIQTDATDPNEAQQLAVYAASVIRSELQDAQVLNVSVSGIVAVDLRLDDLRQHCPGKGDRHDGSAVGIADETLFHRDCQDGTLSVAEFYQCGHHPVAFPFSVASAHQRQRCAVDIHIGSLFAGLPGVGAVDFDDNRYAAGCDADQCYHVDVAGCAVERDGIPD